MYKYFQLFSFNYFDIFTEGTQLHLSFLPSTQQKVQRTFTIPKTCVKRTL